MPKASKQYQKAQSQAKSALKRANGKATANVKSKMQNYVKASSREYRRITGNNSSSSSNRSNRSSSRARSSLNRNRNNRVSRNSRRKRRR